MWYRIQKLKDERATLKEEIRKGNATKAIIDRIFEINLLLDNIYYIDDDGL